MPIISDTRKLQTTALSPGSVPPVAATKKESKETPSVKKQSENNDLNTGLNQRLAVLEVTVRKNHDATTRKLDQMTEILSRISNSVEMFHSETKPAGLPAGPAQALRPPSLVPQPLNAPMSADDETMDVSTSSSRLTQEDTDDELTDGIIQVESDGVLAVKSDKWMINPKNGFRMMWDLCLILPILVYLSFVTPFRLCFANEAVVYSPIFWFEFGVDLTFIVDIIFNFRTGVLVELPGRDGLEVVEYDRWRVAASYCKGWFLLDLVSGIPFALLEVAAGNQKASGGPMASLKSIKSLKLLRFLKLGRLLKLDKILTNLDRDTKDCIEDFLQNGATRAMVTTLKLLFFLVYSTHLFACGFVVIGKVGSNAGVLSWFDFEVKGPFVSKDTTGANGSEAVYSIYVAAFYFTVTTITSVGFGDIYTRNDLERVYVIVLELVGAFAFAAVIGSITSVVTSMDMNAQKTSEQLDSVASFVKVRNIPEALGRRIRRHFRQFYSVKSAIDETRIFSDLSTSLRKEVSGFLVSELMGDRSFFIKLPKSLWPKMLPLLRPMSFERGEVVCVQGEACSEMLVVLAGTLKGSTVVEGESEPWQRRITTGDSINVLLVLSIWSECIETVTAQVSAETYAISSDDFTSLFKSDADKATFAQLQIKEVSNYKMNPNFPGSPTAAGKPLHFACFSLVEISVGGLAGSLLSSNSKRLVQVLTPRSRSASTDSPTSLLWMVVDLVNDEGTPFEQWRHKTQKVSVSREDISSASWSDVIRWADVSVPFNKAVVRMRLYESEGGNYSSTCVVGSIFLPLRHVESEGEAEAAGLELGKNPGSGKAYWKPPYSSPKKPGSVEAWFDLGQNKNEVVSSSPKASPNTTSSIALLPDKVAWAHIRLAVKRPHNKPRRPNSKLAAGGGVAGVPRLARFSKEAGKEAVHSSGGTTKFRKGASRASTSTSTRASANGSGMELI